MQKIQKARLHHLDLLRMIACLSVVMIHISAEFVVRGNGGPDFWLGNLMDSLSRAGVPLFVMISGALMLDEEYEFTKKSGFAISAGWPRSMRSGSWSAGG